jgi:hypothetical protein
MIKNDISRDSFARNVCKIGVPTHRETHSSRDKVVSNFFSSSVAKVHFLKATIEEVKKR